MKVFSVKQQGLLTFCTSIYLFKWVPASDRLDCFDKHFEAELQSIMLSADSYSGSDT